MKIWNILLIQQNHLKNKIKLWKIVKIKILRKFRRKVSKKVRNKVWTKLSRKVRKKVRKRNKRAKFIQDLIEMKR